VRRVLAVVLLLPALVLSLVLVPAGAAQAQVLGLCLGIVIQLGGPDGIDDDGDGDPCDDDQPDYDFVEDGPSTADNVVLRWNNQVLEAIRTTKPPPPVAARSLAIVHTAMYDAWASFDDTAVPTRRELWIRQPFLLRTEANKARAISFAAHQALVDQFPQWRSRLDGTLHAATGLLRALGYNPVDGTLSAVEGMRAAEAVLAHRQNDGANEGRAYADTTGYRPANAPLDLRPGAVYTPPRFPERWQPLWLPGQAQPQQAAVPHWRRVRPFALSTAAQFQPDGPRLDPAATSADMLQVSADLDDRQKVTAEYWADGPSSELPPGHWNLFAQVVSRQRGHSLDDDVRLFFALNNAQMDASIAAWEAKYRWDFVRPVGLVRQRHQGQRIRSWAGPYLGTREIAGEQWLPYQRLSFVTPAFPDYVSGHSTFSMAAATVLQTFTGSDAFGAAVIVPPGTSFVEPRTATHPGVPAADVTLSWPTYTAAADEAGVSRRYGGIHFVDADLDGRQLGRDIGRHVWGKARTFWEGTASGGLLGLPLP
jgi:hypothetical protein